MRKKPVDPLI